MGNAESNTETKEQDSPPPPPEPEAAPPPAAAPEAPKTPLMTPPPIKKAKLSLLKSLKDVREPLSQEKTIEALVADEDFSNEHLDRLATSSESESSDSDDDGERRRFELLKVLRNVFSRVGLVLWLLGFTAFYAYSAFDGSWAKGFYWTVQAGLSIGFGVLTEKSALNLWATVLNICLGAGLAGVVLADYATKVGEEKDAWRNEIMLERSLAAAGHEQHKLRKRVRLAKRMIKELEAPAPKITESQLRWGKIRAHVTKRRPQQGSLLPTKEKVLRLKRVVWRAKLGRHGRANAFQRVKLWLRIHRQKLSVLAANFVWLGVGVVYAIAKERWSPTRAIYFAVSSLSTAGLQGIPLASKDWQYAFVGVWCLVGVPLFAAGVGELAGLFVREDCEVEARAQEWGSYGESDWDAAVGALRRHIDLTGDSLTREQFLVSQLLLSGATSHDVVDIIYDRFRTINTDDDDAITREEFLAHVHTRHEHRAPTPAHVKLARKLSAKLHV